MDPGPDRAPNLEADDVDLETGAHPEDVELPGPEPTMDRDPDAFQTMSAAQSGPLPADVERELRRLAEALGAVLEDDEGVVGTRFGRRVIVAPVDNPTDAVDVADVDLPRKLILTLGGEEPTPAGALLAQVLFQRREMDLGYARAPDIDGPTLPVLQQVLPALRGPRAVDLDGVGEVALGHRPAGVAGAVRGLREESDGDGEASLDPDSEHVNTV